jgi:hypothetical protein
VISTACSAPRQSRLASPGRSRRQGSMSVRVSSRLSPDPMFCNVQCRAGADVVRLSDSAADVAFCCEPFSASNSLREGTSLDPFSIRESRLAHLPNEIPDRKRIKGTSFPDPRSKFPVIIFRELRKKRSGHAGVSARVSSEPSQIVKIPCIFTDDQGI